MRKLPERDKIPKFKYTVEDHLRVAEKLEQSPDPKHKDLARHHREFAEALRNYLATEK